MIRLILILAFSFSATAFADTCPDGTSYDPLTEKCDCANYHEGQCAKYNAVEKRSVTESRKQCDEAYKKYQDLQKRDGAFMKGCKTTQSRATSRAGVNSCLAAAEKCQLCIGTAEDDELDPVCQNDEDEELDEDEGVNGLSEILSQIRSGQTARRGQYIDQDQVREMKNRFKYCPLYSKEEFDELVDLRKDNKTAKEEGEELLQKQMEELKKAKRELGDLQVEQAKIVPEYTEEFRKIVDDQNQKLQSALEQNGKEMVKMILNLQTAEIQFVDAKNAIYKVCYDRAQQALDRLKENRRRKISAGTLRANNGFAGLMKQTSTEDRLQRYAISVQKKCERRDSEVRKQIRSAEKVYGQQVKQLNLLLSDLQAQQRDITDKLMDAKEDPEEKARLADLKKAYEKRQEDIAKAIAEKLELVENLTVAINKTQEKLQENTVLFNEYKVQEAQARRSGANSADNPTPAEFLSAANEYESSIDDAARLCECTRNDQGGVANDPFSKCSTIYGNMDTNLGNNERGSGSSSRRRGSQ